MTGQNESGRDPVANDQQERGRTTDDRVSGSPSGTRDLSDADFVAAFEGLTLPPERFRHYDHLRLAWILLRESDHGAGAELLAATARMAQGIRRFALHHGAPEKYHETMTRAYMRFMAAHLRLTPHVDDFDEFALVHPRLFDRSLPFAHYSESRLMSAEARVGWVAPDLRPLPAAAPWDSD